LKFDYALSKFKSLGYKDIFKHFKGGHYLKIGEGNHTETGERLTAYTDSKGDLYFHPTEMFNGTVIKDGNEVPRFVNIKNWD